MAGSTMTPSVIERVLFLRKVSLFADLSPADLGRVASIPTSSAIPTAR